MGTGLYLEGRRGSEEMRYRRGATEEAGEIHGISGGKGGRLRSRTTTGWRQVASGPDPNPSLALGLEV